MTFDDLTPPYSTIVADPPWAYPEGFFTRSRTPGKWTGPRREYELPYSSMTLDEIAAMPIGDIAAKDCRLFLWVTNKYLPDAFDILKAWGFRYRQTLVWHKLDALSGSVAPNSAEFFLVAVRGKPPLIGRASGAVHSHSQAKSHSVKPGLFMDLVEQVSPGPYVELFARQPRLGWDAWGYGVEAA